MPQTIAYRLIITLNKMFAIRDIQQQIEWKWKIHIRKIIIIVIIEIQI